MNTKRSKGIIGITLVMIMIASIFAMVAPTAVADPPNPPKDPDFYPNSTIRLYGAPDKTAPERYTDWSQPFDPSVIPSDSVTFNPALLKWDNLTSNSTNAYEKVYLRGWYEPDCTYGSPGYIPRKTHHYPAINLEYTFMMIDAQDYMPLDAVGGTPGDPILNNYVTRLALPVREIADQTGLGGLELVGLASVNGTVSNYNKTTNGTIRVEKSVLLSGGEKYRFFDHEVEFVETSIDAEYAILMLRYLGNAEDDYPTMVIVKKCDTYFVKRHNELYVAASHPDRTWYLHYQFKTQGHKALITVGKELKKCDVFYVDGVRYDVVSVEVLDTNNDTEADALKALTIRTKLPKGNGSVMEESVVSTQNIVCVDFNQMLPVLPPFNAIHSIVDDVNVPLWAPLMHFDKWPVGDPVSGLPNETFPYGERYITQQHPPAAWLTFFRAVPIGAAPTTDPLLWAGPYYPGDANVTWSNWIAYNVKSRVLDDVLPLDAYYISETKDKRLSTDLLEKLWENETMASDEGWTKMDIQTLPDMYTEFYLPPAPDVLGEWRADQVNYTQWMPGDYFVMLNVTSPNIVDPNASFNRVSFYYDQSPSSVLVVTDKDTATVVKEVTGSNNGMDLYVNADPKDITKNVSIRIYGADSPAPWRWDEYDQVFNPTWIRKDSITFDPAILRWENMTASSTDAYVKTYFRAWYDQAYNLSKTKPHSVVTETTYMLIDAQDYLPLYGHAETTRFAFPVYATLDDGKADGLDRLELVDLSWIREDDVGPNNKTVKGGIQVEKTYLLDIDEKIQFMDHELEIIDTDLNNGTLVAKVRYVGNKDGLVDGESGYLTLSNCTTYWFDRHNAMDLTANHPERTWYAHFIFKTQSHKILITVGKELQWCDIFFVDGRRYEVTALETLDTDGGDRLTDAFKFITLRAPFPKGDVEIDDGNAELSGVSSQWVWNVSRCNPIPVLPPLNMIHEIVDDTDVQLWYPLRHVEKFQEGDPNGILDVEYWPCGERFLTQQRPPPAWMQFFKVVPIGAAPVTDPQLWDGPYHPGDSRVNWNNWIAFDVKKRIIGGVDPLEFCWLSETFDQRLSTNLLEVLYENVTGTDPIVENWTKYDIRTMPDKYTEFRLPVIPSLMGEDYQPYCYYDQKYFKPDIKSAPGSYIITTSWMAPNAGGDMNKNQSYYNESRYAFAFNATYGKGLYIEEDPPLDAELPCNWTYYLDEGSDLISFKAIPADPSPAAIFGPGVTVLGYDPVGGWYVPTAVEPGKGYYIYAPAPMDVEVFGDNVKGIDTWQTIKDDLEPGWNLVGPGDASIEILDTLGIAAIYGDDMVLHSGDDLKCGSGYWILVTP